MSQKPLTGRVIFTADEGAPSAPAIDSSITQQINFRGSPGMATLLARLAVEHGSIRLVIARLLQGAGHSVPEADLAVPPGRRRV